MDAIIAYLTQRLKHTFASHPLDFTQFASESNRQVTSLDEFVAKLESILEQ